MRRQQRCDSEPCGGLLEALEPRLLLSGQGHPFQVPCPFGTGPDASALADGPGIAVSVALFDLVHHGQPEPTDFGMIDYGQTAPRGSFTVLGGTAVNEAPQAADDSFVVVEDKPLTFDVNWNDYDVEDHRLTSFTLSTLPVHGNVINMGRGMFRYRPNSDYVGPDSFIYTVADSSGLTDTACVTLIVVNTPDKPDIVDDFATVLAEAGPQTIDVLANDTLWPDPPADSDKLTITAVTQGQHGSVVVVDSGTALTYEPRGHFIGQDVFTYSATDQDGLTAVASVQVTVIPEGLYINVGTGQAKSVTYTDADGTIVTVTEKRGAAALHFLGERIWTETAKDGATVYGENLQLADIEMIWSNKGSTLSIKTAGGLDDGTIIGEISGNFQLGKLAAKGVDLVASGIRLGPSGSIMAIE
ncbi:MAG: Ig-like domain-containing protein, partial [Planctomycetes bacterium]|nr:Ig-like domain-containing protein [Planctomycetota bacterium]